MVGLMLAIVAVPAGAAVALIRLLFGMRGGAVPYVTILRGSLWYSGVLLLIGLGLFLFGWFKSRPVRTPP